MTGPKLRWAGTRRWLLPGVAVISATVTLMPAPTAFAAWTTSGSGAGGAAAATMPTGTAPSASVSGHMVALRWSAAALSNGTAVAGYVIHRYNASNGSPATVGAGCSGVITSTTCTEQNVPSGTWLYTDTPVQSNWTGGESPASGAVSVP